MVEMAEILKLGNKKIDEKEMREYGFLRCRQGDNEMRSKHCGPSLNIYTTIVDFYIVDADGLESRTAPIRPRMCFDP